MVLSDAEIEEAIAAGEIRIDPPPHDRQYNTSSLDLTLGTELLMLKPVDQLQKEQPKGLELSLVVDLSQIDIKDLFKKYTKRIAPQNDGSFILGPHMFVVGLTRETIRLPAESKIAARVEGRSTLARLGLVVHLTAPTIHAGFDGKIALEMCNFGPYELRLRPGKLHICQLVFERLGKAPKRAIRTVFTGQQELRPPNQG